MIHCPPVGLSAPLVDVGFGMPHEIESCVDSLPGSIAVVENADEPFTTAVPLPDRLRALAAAGCVAAIAVEPRAGGHVETVRATDKRWNEKAGDVLSHPLPTVQTHREDGSQTAPRHRQDIRAACREQGIHRAMLQHRCRPTGRGMARRVARARRSSGHVHGIARSRGRRLRSGRPAGGHAPACHRPEGAWHLSGLGHSRLHVERRGAKPPGFRSLRPATLRPGT